MEVPSMLQGESLKRLLQGIAIGVALTVIVGFNWFSYGFGWTLGGSAGGHGAMAGARVPLRGRSADLLATDLFAAFLRAFHLRPGPGTPFVPLGP